MAEPLRAVESPEWREFDRLMLEGIVRRVRLPAGADRNAMELRLCESLLALIRRTPHPIDRMRMIPTAISCVKLAGMSSETVDELFVQYLEEVSKAERYADLFTKTGIWTFVVNLWTCPLSAGRIQDCGPVFRECLEWSGDLLVDAIRTGNVKVLGSVHTVMESIIDFGQDPGEFPLFCSLLREEYEVLRSRADEYRGYTMRESNRRSIGESIADHYLELLEQFVNA